ncbi:glucan biosynthesis protein G [Marinobacter orientalis]|uniref:Glucan biosynthesis protein G n=1 Tax=Marinobacter orientalis TaxID=1928859 RepID=A0A7Y0RCQ0_9GAMM|nr:glucan biosynthesis protein G [Marinobacter orientalis]NMT63826.1 glucan biosynthesis protein G [Marinobacter orientalis]TGX49930.1 glucan biosynthesis protein G [Marinobacter orientalis]
MRSGTGLLTLLTLQYFLYAIPAQAFEFGDVVDRARTLAEGKYESPPEVPGFLRDLDYQNYQAIRFNPEMSLWREGRSRFQVMTVPPGNFYTHTVKLNEIDADGVEPIPFDKSAYSFPDSELAKRVPADLGHAGFKLTFPLGEGTEQNQFLVFAGASYFRGVGADNRFGLSARGIAVNTGLPSGEEFPSFVEFWLERPAAGSDRMRVYGLLNGPSVSGAYRFDVHPGPTTRIDVTAELFFRNAVEQPGLAPLTSMFYYGENTKRPVGEWRPQVHDSDGLLIHDAGSDEWLWRPLVNPSRLRLSYLQVNRLGGFGLIQRDTAFHQFEDAEARYDLRPSAWVSPRQGWSDGEVVLVEIPTDSETNDNIVAFWKPGEDASAGAHHPFAYSLSFGGPDVAGQETGWAVKTFVGDGDRTGGGDAENAYRIIVDFAGGPLDELKPGAAVVSNVSGGGDSGGAEIIEHYVEFIEADNNWRLSMLVRPGKAADPVLRGQLLLDDKPLTEVWTYSLSEAARAAQGGS